MDSDATDIPVLDSSEYAELLQKARDKPDLGGWASSALTAASFALFFAGVVGLFVFGSGWPVVVAAGVVMALGMLMLSLVVHECAHRTLFEWRWANDLVGAFAGLITVTPLYSYRRGHVAHHRYVGSSEGKDPTASPQDEFSENRVLDVVLRTGILPVFYWGGVYGPYLLYDLFPTAGDRRNSHVAAWVGNMAVVAGFHLGLAWLVGPWAYLGAFVIGFVGSGMLYENLFTLNQHIGLMAVPGKKERYSYREQLNFSRTVEVPLAALIFYFNLHKEHHLAPGLNWRYLPVLHRLLRRHCPEIYEFTDEELAIARRRKMRAHELLTPEIGD